MELNKSVLAQLDLNLLLQKIVDTVTRAGDGALLVQAHMDWGTIDLRTEQPTHIPSTFLADLAPNIAGGLP